MGTWRAFKQKDDERNICFCIQNGDDESTFEVLEFIEPDIARQPDMIEQAKQYMQEAEEGAARRNQEGEK